MTGSAIHSAFCDECGGWTGTRVVRIAAFEYRVDCEACDEVIALLRIDARIEAVLRDR